MADRLSLYLRSGQAFEVYWPSWAGTDFSTAMLKFSNADDDTWFQFTIVGNDGRPNRSFAVRMSEIAGISALSE